jgi:hypothetical protein
VLSKKKSKTNEYVPKRPKTDLEEYTWQLSDKKTIKNKNIKLKGVYPVNSNCSSGAVKNENKLLLLKNMLVY